MKKKILYYILICCSAVFSVYADRKNEVTLLLVPREDGAIRVGMDFANRYPTLLLSYKVANNGGVSLHGWSGKEWVNVALDDFREGNFFKNGPNTALVIEGEGDTVPETIIPSEKWCDEVYKITTTEIRPLLHLIGKHYNFEYKEWAWFAENYRLSYDAINPDGLNTEWYHKRLNEHLKKRDAVVGNDLQYWLAIRFPEVEQVQAVDATTNALDQVETEEEIKLESEEALEDNPLTNSIPEAVILAAGPAEEAIIIEEPVEAAEKE